MRFYGAEHHMLLISNKIDADEHRHSFLQITIALADECEVSIEGEAFSFAGMMINANVAHQIKAVGHPIMLFLIDSTSNLAASFMNYVEGRPYYIFSPEKVIAIRQLVKSEYATIDNNQSYINFLEKLLMLFEVEPATTTIDDERIIEFIKLLKDCTESEHTISQYAKQLGLSNSRLSHLFKEKTGISLSGYILLHKLQKAIYLILNGLSITDAAMEAGFDSPSHLAATSKKLLGMSAKDIRKDSVFLKVSLLH